MVVSSDTTSFVDQSTSVFLLNMNTGQNLILDLTASRYNEALKPMIECLYFSPLAPALTMAEYVRLHHLSKAYTSTPYVDIYRR